MFRVRHIFFLSFLPRPARHVVRYKFLFKRIAFKMNLASLQGSRLRAPAEQLRIIQHVYYTRTKNKYAFRVHFDHFRRPAPVLVCVRFHEFEGSCYFWLPRRGNRKPQKIICRSQETIICKNRSQFHNFTGTRNAANFQRRLRLFNLPILPLLFSYPPPTLLPPPPLQNLGRSKNHIFSGAGTGSGAAEPKLPEPISRVSAKAGDKFQFYFGLDGSGSLAGT